MTINIMPSLRDFENGLVFIDEVIKKVKTKEEKERLHQLNKRSVLRIVSVGVK